ncbi:hypothetical protein [Streptomyces sp. NPDC051567]|uniref:hypothetical protein n=1 Tax=Streptomyces sp. NPDC051567 TaxID=3365660 RepID=UPI0037B251A2
MGDAKKMIYGPLELVDGRCGMGDSRRPGGSWVEFRTEGMVRHTGGTEGDLIPWSRVMMGICVYIGQTSSTMGYAGEVGVMGILGGLPGPFKGRFGGNLRMTLRHPYEDHDLTFDRHAHWYKPTHVMLLAGMMKYTVDAGEPHRLGDTDWLWWAVGRLEAVTSWPKWQRPETVVQAALED